MSVDWQAIGARLRQAREAQGLRAGHVAKALRITEATVSRHENGLRPIPLHRLIAWAAFLHRPLAWVLGDEVPEADIAVAGAVQRAVMDFLPVRPVPVRSATGAPTEEVIWVLQSIACDWAWRQPDDSLSAWGILSGDWLLCVEWRPIQPLRADDLVLVAGPEGWRAAWLRCRDGRWWLESGRPAEWIEPTGWRPLARVVQVQRVAPPDAWSAAAPPLAPDVPVRHAPAE
jgi:transcriptional regulator with XRE-family HTH domain